MYIYMYICVHVYIYISIYIYSYIENGHRKAVCTRGRQGVAAGRAFTVDRTAFRVLDSQKQHLAEL